MKNIEFLKTLKNPLDDENKLKKILESYSNNPDLYEEILDVDFEERYSDTVDTNDIDEFEVELFKIWQKNVKNFTLAKQFLVSNGKDKLKEAKDTILKANPKNAKQVRKFFEKYSKKSKKDDCSEVIRLIRYKDDFSSENIAASSKRLCLNDEMGEIKHQLYLNMDSDVQYPFATTFVKKCVDKNLPFKFSFDENDFSKNFTILSDEEHLNDYINIIEEIKKENETIKEGINTTPLLTSTVKDNIGYSETTTDYVKSRSKLLKESLDLITEKVTKEGLKNKNIEINNESKDYKEFLSQIIYDNKMTELRSKYSNDNKKGFLRKLFNSKSRKIEKESFQKNLKDMINSNLDIILKGEFKSEKIDYEDLESIKLSTFKSVSLTEDDIQKALRTQLKVLSNKDNFYKKVVKETIKRKSEKHNISGYNLCLSDSTGKQLFGSKTSTNTDSKEKKPTEEKKSTETKKKVETKKETIKPKTALDSMIDESKKQAKSNAKTNDKKDMSKVKQETVEEEKGEEYIEGTNIKKPRIRGIYETDEEYVNYLKAYCAKFFPETVSKNPTKNKETYTYKPMTDEEIKQARENIEYEKYEKIYAERNKTLRAQREVEELAKKKAQQEKQAKETYTYKPMTDEEIKQARENIEYEKYEKIYAERNKALRAQREAEELAKKKAQQETKTTQKSQPKQETKTTHNKDSYTIKGKQLKLSTPEDVLNLLRDGNISLVNNGTINITINNYEDGSDKPLTSSIQYDKDQVKVLKRVLCQIVGID